MLGLAGALFTIKIRAVAHAHGMFSYERKKRCVTCVLYSHVGRMTK